MKCLFLPASILFVSFLNGNYSVSTKTSSIILPDASYLGSANWYESSWFGTFFETTNSWLYHTNLGWLYIPSSTTNNLWIYNPDLKWLWTTATFYPWLYVSELKEWRYYSNQKGFYTPNTKQWLNKSDLIAQFTSSLYTSASYSSGNLVSNNNLSAWFDRSIEINGLMLVIAGEVGGQVAVPDEWAKKVAQTVKLLTDPNSEGIDISSQEQMIKVLKGETGTWHAGFSSVQRIAYGSGADYSPNPLTDSGRQSYLGYENFQDSNMMNDMIWYRNSSDGAPNSIGDYDIAEVLEHLMHTIHLYGVPGAVPNSSDALQWDPDFHSGWQTSELYFAVKEAVDNGVFNLADYRDENINSPETYRVVCKEYLYLLNFGMWEFGQEFWENGTLSPEWSDQARTPTGVKELNPLGFSIFNSYIKPILSKPSLSALRSIFQDNDSGISGYQAD